MIKITASVLTDLNYLIPALLTASHLKNYYSDTVIILVVDPAQKQDLALVQDLLALPAFSELKVLTLNEFLPRFSYAHFNHTIIYKLLVPDIVGEGSDAIVLFDAGIVTAMGFESYKRELDILCENIISDRKVMGCYIHPINSPICSTIQSAAEDNGWDCKASYPSGVVLIFNNSGEYGGSTFRLTDMYAKYLDRLAFADQELIMLLYDRSLVQGISTEIKPLSLFLSLSFASWESWSSSDLENSAWWKICGSVKPWKNWCVDPNRRFYLSELLRVFGDDSFSRNSPLLQDFFWSGGERFFKPSVESFNRFIYKFFK